MIEVESPNHLNSIFRDYPVVVVDIYADWCNPCKMFGPKYADIAAEYSNPKVAFVKCNADKNIIPGVSGLPTIFFFISGKKVGDVLGGDVAEVSKKLSEIYQRLNLRKEGSIPNRQLPPIPSNSVRLTGVPPQRPIIQKGRGSGYSNYESYGRDQRTSSNPNPPYLPQPNSVRNFRK